MHNLFEQDKIKREEIIKNSLIIAFEDSSKIINKNNVKEFFKSQFNKYIPIHMTNDKYSNGNYWFNDAGFQFMWRNHKNCIVPECLTWGEIYNRVNELNL